MALLTLVIGNKNYSSWSLRPWLALKLSGAPFREIKVLLDQPDSRDNLLVHSPTGRVPVLKDGDLTVWDSLAICEYLAERYPGLWPAEPTARALSRSIAAEMHAGFPDLRRELSMNLRARLPKPTVSAAAQRDIDRVCAIWRDCLGRYGGPWLFGMQPTIADCMYAPVASRFATYGTALDKLCASYRDQVLALPALQEWLAEAQTEPELPGH